MNNTEKTKTQLIRELEIRDAVDRVRAEAAAMQKSSDVVEVVKALWMGLKDIGLVFQTCGIQFVNESANMLTLYAAGETNPLFTHKRICKDMVEGIDLNTTDIPLAFARERGYAMPGVTPSILLMPDTFPQDLAQIWDMPSPEAFSEFAGLDMLNIPTADGGVIIFAPGDHRYTPHDLQIGKDFAEAVSLGFTRYSDFRRLEEQNRELFLEQSAQRVRNEAAEMKSSGDLRRVVGIMTRQLIDADTHPNWCNIHFYDEGAQELIQYTGFPKPPNWDCDSEAVKQVIAGWKGFEFDEKLFALNPFSYTLDSWANAGDNARKELAQQGASEESVPNLVASYKAWQTKENQWIKYLMSDEDLIKMNKAAHATSELPPPENMRGEHTLVFIPFAHGIVEFARFGEVDNDVIDMLDRFKDALSLGFQRFLDFQQLEEQNRDLEEANAQIQEATRLKSQFLATMSHELRTPMNAIIGFTRLVLKRAENLADRQRENLEKVKLSADHLLNLINEILDLSKIEAGRIDIQPAILDLEKLVANCCATVGPTLGKSSVTLSYDVADDAVEVFSDEARLRQIVINLLSNALKFTDEGEVKIAVTVKGTYPQPRPEGRGEKSKSGDRQTQGITGSDGGQVVEVSVSDMGIGIPEDQLDAIFEEFRQVDGSSTRKIQGTGLGLAITKKLVELLGGSIGVSSVLGEGSTFTFRIPARYGE
ncbi:MAG: hypothetical protein HN521_04860, partial [Candidatus Latescibacteria bacterium]|nr:hypothetical protein [Candidatus Latescibacterota bacterium]